MNEEETSEQLSTGAPPEPADSEGETSEHEPADGAAAEREETKSKGVAPEEPYDWDECTVSISINLFPRKGKKGPRRVVIGCNTHRDVPLLKSTEQDGLNGLLPILGGMLKQLREELPERGRKAEAKRKTDAEAAEAKRKADAEAAERRKKRQQELKTYENDSHNFLHFSNLNISLGAESKIDSLCVFQSSRIGNL